MRDPATNEVSPHEDLPKDLLLRPPSAEDIEVTTRAVRSETVDNNLGRDRGAYTTDELVAWFHELVTPKIAGARATGEWGSLIPAQFEEYDQYSACARLFAIKHPDWYRTLAELGGLMAAEVDAVKATSRTLGCKKGGGSNRRFDEATILEWIKSDLEPCVEAVRVSGNWNALLAKHWENDDHFNTFKNVPGQGMLPWRSALVQRNVITEEESQLVSKAVVELKTVRATKFSDTDLQAWIDETVAPVVAQALKDGKWQSLSRSTWRTDPHFIAGTTRLTGRSGNWYGLLTAACGLGPEHIQKIKRLVRVNAAADFIAPKFSDAEIDLWIETKIRPVLARAREEGTWHSLRSAEWVADEHSNSAIRRFGGGWDSVLTSGLGLSVDELSKTREEGRALQISNLAASRLRKTAPAALEYEGVDATTLAAQVGLREQEFRGLLGPAVAAARASHQWGGLTIAALGAGSELVAAGMRLTQISSLKADGLNGWYAVIERYGGLNKDEIKLIRQAANEEKMRKLGAPRRFTEQHLEEWVAKELSPVVRQARESGKWEIVMGKYWQDRPEYGTLCHLYGKHVSDWWGVLSHFKLLTESELQLARAAAQKERTTLSGRGNRKYSEEEIATWFAGEVAPRIALCRRGGDWGILMLAAWRGDPHFNTACKTTAKSSNNWYGLLQALGGITTEEAALIRAEGTRARFRQRTTPTVGAFTYERGGKAKQQIIVVEKLILGNSTREETDFTPVITKLLRSTASHPVTVRAAAPSRIKAVLEVRGNELQRDHLSPADLLRLSLPRLHSASDWSFAAPRYKDVLPSLSSYLATRVAVRYWKSLVESGVISSPRNALSVGSGTGDLYDAARDMMDITDLDFSSGMLALSPNPKKICANATSISVPDRSFEMVECSSLYRMGSSDDLKKILEHFHRILQPGGFLWLKGDGILFSDKFVNALNAMGFEFLAPSNCNLSIPQEILDTLDPKLRKRSITALNNTFFIFARKTLEEPGLTNAEDLTFLRKRPVSEDIGHIQFLLRGLLRSATDREYIINVRTFVDIMSTLEPETFEQKGALAVGLLHKYLGVLFTRDEIGKLPTRRDLSSLDTKLGQHQKLVDTALQVPEKRGGEPDPVLVYVREIKRAVDHLAQLASESKLLA